MTALIAGTFGLVGVLTGGAITAWIQHLRIKDERQQRAAEEAQAERLRDAIAVSEVIAAVSPWQVNIGHLLDALLNTAQRAPEIREQYYESGFHLSTRFIAAKVLTQNQAIRDGITALADQYNIAVTLIDDATASPHQSSEPQYLERFRELRTQIDHVIRKLEQAATRRLQRHSPAVPCLPAYLTSPPRNPRRH